MGIKIIFLRCAMFLLAYFFAFSLFGAETAAKGKSSPSEMKAELKKKFLKSASKNKFGDFAIVFPNVDRDAMEKAEGMLFGHPYAFLYFFDSGIDLELLKKISENEKELRKIPYKSQALAIVGLYLKKKYHINLKNGEFKASPIKKSLNDGIPVFVFMNLSPNEFRNELKNRMPKRNASASSGEWVKCLKDLKKLKSPQNQKFLHAFIIGYNAQTNEYCVFYAEKVCWLTEAELKDLVFDMYFAVI